jgi:hypothetical protein
MKLKKLSKLLYIIHRCLEITFRNLTIIHTSAAISKKKKIKN